VLNGVNKKLITSISHSTFPHCTTPSLLSTKTIDKRFLTTVCCSGASVSDSCQTPNNRTAFSAETLPLVVMGSSANMDVLSTTLEVSFSFTKRYTIMLFVLLSSTSSVRMTSGISSIPLITTKEEQCAPTSTNTTAVS
jgi:hypothetical protein